MTAIVLSHRHDVLESPPAAAKRWPQHSGTVASIILHGVFIAAIWGVSRIVPQHAPPLPERAIELVLIPAEPKQLAPLPVAPETRPAPPKAAPHAASPKAAPDILPRTVPRTVPATAEKAETAAPPPVAAEPARAAPAEAPPAPPAPARPRVIATEGIPTDYVNQVHSRINGKAVYPRVAKMRGDEGRVLYKISLTPQGDLMKYEIQSSGNEVLDKAAVDAIKAAAPFPRLPDLGGSAYLLSGAIVFSVL